MEKVRRVEIRLQMFIVVVGVFCVLLTVICLYVCYYWNFVSRRGVRVWVSSFECGFLRHGVSERYFRSSFFLLLVFFVLFDLEVSLLLNIAFQGILFKKFVFYVLFICCLCFGYLVEVETGYIGWLGGGL